MSVKYINGWALKAGPPNIGQTRRRQGKTIEFPPELYPPENSKTILLTDVVTNLVGVGTIASPAGLALTLDTGEQGVIRGLEIFADNPTLTTSALWRIRVNGNPVQGLGNVTMIFRVASSLARDFDNLRVVIPPGGSVGVDIVNQDGAARTFGAQLIGWRWPVLDTITPEAEGHEAVL
jgi:hypothetical protein